MHIPTSSTLKLENPLEDLRRYADAKRLKVVDEIQVQIGNVFIFCNNQKGELYASLCNNPGTPDDTYNALNELAKTLGLREDAIENGKRNFIRRCGRKSKLGE